MLNNPRWPKVYARRRRKRWYRTIWYRDDDGKAKHKSAGNITEEEAAEIKAQTKAGQNLATPELIEEYLGNIDTGISDAHIPNDAVGQTDRPLGAADHEGKTQQALSIDRSKLPPMDRVIAQIVEGYPLVLGGLSALEMMHPNEPNVTVMVDDIQKGFRFLKRRFAEYLWDQDASHCRWPGPYPPLKESTF
jgi:hypothetical protein